MRVLLRRQVHTADWNETRVEASGAQLIRISADRTRCAGVGLCEGWAPDIFEVGEDHKVTVKCLVVSDDRLADVQGAVDDCPTGTLSYVIAEND